jgi:hypothetical protein
VLEELFAAEVLEVRACCLFRKFYFVLQKALARERYNIAWKTIRIFDDEIFARKFR